MTKKQTGATVYEHDPDPSFCHNPGDKKPHVHQAEGDPTCSVHGMMTQPKAGKKWECMAEGCSVATQP